MLFRRFLLLIGLLLAGYIAPVCPQNPDHEFYHYDPTYEPGLRVVAEPAYGDDFEKAQAVVEAFRHSWKGYYHGAFGRDTLRPLTISSVDDMSGFGSTAIESLTTAIIMGERPTMNRIMALITTINFTVTKRVSEEVDVYQATIRLVGSMLSAFDLLNGPYRRYATSKYQLDTLLDQAVTFAEGSLAEAFRSDTRLPSAGILMTPKVVRSGRLENALGAAAGMVVEWDALGIRSGVKRIWRMSREAFEVLPKQPILHDKFVPGLFSEKVNTKSGGFADKNTGYNHNTGPYYHGMIKWRNMDPRQDNGVLERWQDSAESIMKHLTSHPVDHDNMTFLAAFSKAKHIPRAQLTTCSAGAMFMFGGATLQRQRYIDFGLRLAETCWTVASSMPSGLPPRKVSWVDVELTAGTRRNPLPPLRFEAFANMTGFWPTDRSYHLESDLVETLYYAYRITGDPKWQERAWDTFVSINSTCRVEGGFSSIRDVTVTNRQDLDGNPIPLDELYLNKMDGEWMSRTLKYLYLTFAPDSPVQLKWNGDGAFVFSHGGHPIEKPLWRRFDAQGKKRHPQLPPWNEIEDGMDIAP